MEMEAKGDRDWPSHMACQTGSPGFLALLLPSGSHPSTFLAFSPHLIKQVPTEGCTVRACLRDPRRPRKPCLNPSPPPASQESSHRGPFSHLGQQLRRAWQKYWSGLPLHSPGDLPDPGIEPGSPELQTDSLPSDPPGSPPDILMAKSTQKDVQHH